MKTFNHGMRRGAISIALLLVLAASASAQDLTPKFEDYMNALSNQKRFIGSVLVARDGKVVFRKGYGMANVELDVPNDPRNQISSRIDNEAIHRRGDSAVAGAWQAERHRSDLQILRSRVRAPGAKSRSIICSVTPAAFRISPASPITCRR